MNAIVAFLFLLLTSLHGNSNFELSNGCLVDIQAKKNQYKKSHYTSLIFDQNINDARKKAKKAISKKINLQIQSTSTLYYRSEIIKKNNIYLKNKTQKEFKQSISTFTLDLDIDLLENKEFYCKSDDEVFFLYTIKREDIYNLAKSKLETLRERNNRIFNNINNEKNILSKVLLFEKIKTNYLPYLMILEHSKIDIALRKNYFEEMLKYDLAYNSFLNSIVFYVDIKYPYNRVYPVEERVDEVRQEVIKYLAKHSIYASHFQNVKSINAIAKEQKKDIALITVTLEKIGERYYLIINLQNTYKPRKTKVEKMSSFNIGFEKYQGAWELKLKDKIITYNKNQNLVYKLAKIPHNNIFND